MSRPAERGVDVALGAAVLVRESGRTVRRVLGPVARPIGGFLLRPPLLPATAQPARWIDRAAWKGRAEREALVAAVTRLLDEAVPAVLTEVLRRAGLTELVIRYVDLDAVVAAVDLDEAVQRVDLDRAVARVDVRAVVDRVDVDAVARRLDVTTVLDRLDLTQLVLDRVDLRRLAHAVLATLDLPAIANEVIDEIDLPEIIRESSGSMASETVRSARMQGIAADEAVGRAVDRLLLRRGARG